jgi:hypothetical protein
MLLAPACALFLRIENSWCATDSENDGDYVSQNFLILPPSNYLRTCVIFINPPVEGGILTQQEVKAHDGCGLAGGPGVGNGGGQVGVGNGGGQVGVGEGAGVRAVAPEAGGDAARAPEFG